MTEIQKKISNFIEDQFPDFYRDGTDITTSERSVIVDFLEAYYEYIEANYNTNFLASRNLFEYKDIDTTLDEFIRYFKTKYLNEFPIINGTDERLVVKNILDLYRAKGTEASVKLLIRLLFNKDSSVYLPAEEILKPSFSTWVLPEYLELTRSERNRQLLGKIITGSNSGTTAFAQDLVTKRVNGKLIDILYISNIVGDGFITGELVSDTTSFWQASRIVGSLSSIDITEGFGGYQVGDILDVVSENGVLATARITEVFDVNNRVDFRLVDGGYGYSIDEAEVLISRAILFLDNSGLNFENFDTITQPLFQIETDGNTALYSVADSVVILDETAAEVAEGFVVDKTANTITIERTSGTLINTFELTLNSNSTFVDGETVREASEVILSIDNQFGTFVVGNDVLQADISNTFAYTSIALGTIDAANTTTITLVDVRGTFIVGKDVQDLTTEAVETITAVNVTYAGVAGTLLSTNGDVITVETSGTFTANTFIYGDISKNAGLIDSLTVTGPAEIFVANTHTANVVSISDVSAVGEVLGQNQNIVAVTGNTYPYYVTEGAENLIYSGNTSYEITRIGLGSGANYRVGSLVAGTQETITYKSDFIRDTNINGALYLDIIIGTGENSYFGNIANVEIISGGTGYSNTDTIILSGGGINGGEALIPAEFELVVDGNGTITDVNIISAGFAYVTEPTESISGGSGASLQFNVQLGYGFPGLPEGDFNTGTIDEILLDKTKTIGEIATLTAINPGINYDTNLFTKIIERDIAPFNKYDVVLTYGSSSGVFRVGEIVSANTGAEGRIETVNTTQLKVKRLSFDAEFEVDDIITGGASGATGTLTAINESSAEDQMGLNANITALVGLQTGVIAAVEVLSSGYGYINEETLQLLSANGSIGATGEGTVATSGRESGFWKSTESHLNDQKLHDNDFYQEYSYQIIASLSFDKYSDIVKDLVHLSGTKLFGSVENNLAIDSTYQLNTSSIEQA